MSQENMQNYIKERLEGTQKWYSDKAKDYKKKFQSTKAISAIISVLIPVITNLPLDYILFKSVDIGDAIVTLLGLAVASLVAWEGVYHYKEQWVNYRSTAEYLKSQRILFSHNAEDYSGLDPGQSFRQLVARVEKAIAEENAVTLNVLSRTEQYTEKKVLQQNDTLQPAK